MIKPLFVFALFCALTACASPRVEAPVPTPASQIQLLPAVDSPANQDVFEVEAWVDNPTPSAGERINISGSLKKNGVYVGGMMMSGFWPDEDDDRLPDCHIQVIYQRGICIVYADNFPVGEYTPVRVSFDYFGQTFSGETGFTRSK
jgi:hypothetical protein